jgi:hypothetical protein
MSEHNRKLMYSIQRFDDVNGILNMNSSHIFSIKSYSGCVISFNPYGNIS